MPATVKRRKAYPIPPSEPSLVPSAAPQIRRLRRILFEGIANPKMMKKAFSYALDTSGVAGLKGRKDAFEELYREGIEYGVFNTQVQMSDMKNLMRDVKWGADIGNTDAILRPMLARLKGIGSWAQGKYVAEDDFWKGATWFVERYRYKKAYQKAFDAGKISKMPTDNEIKGLTAKLVRNNVPNYDYVSEFVRSLRRWPVGNFMAFPAEIMRTSTNIVRRGLDELTYTMKVGGKEVRPLASIGMQRLIGMGLTTAAVPYGAVKLGQTLYDISDEQLAAIKRYVAPWAKNSTIIPLKKDNGEFK